ncbi:MAG TPA: polyphenol oxidase family protein [Acidimicrobiales bacterium]|nr:polyphenol oxidase family protein [Acidimicrobiales bacterium]
MSGTEVAWVKQVHGSTTVVVADAADSGQQADALVTVRNDLSLLVRTADCAPIAMAAPEGVVAVAHGGWRGLIAGVIEATTTTMREHGARQIQAGLGPCIHPCCYEFGSSDLDEAVSVLGDSLRAEDASGRPALNLPAAVRAALERAGVELIFESGSCTGCEANRFWSHRVRGDIERQGVLAWLN